MINLQGVNDVSDLCTRTKELQEGVRACGLPSFSIIKGCPEFDSVFIAPTVALSATGLSNFVKAAAEVKKNACKNPVAEIAAARGLAETVEKTPPHSRNGWMRRNILVHRRAARRC